MHEARSSSWLAMTLRMLDFFKPLKDLLAFREVLQIFISADLKVRYRRSFLGYLWGMLNPLATIAVFAFVFSRIMRFPDTRDYVLYIFAGLLPWQYLSNCLIGSTHTIINVEPLLKKVYLPKVLFPVAAVVSRFMDFAFNLIAVFVVVSIINFKPSWALTLLPLAIGILFITTTFLAAALAIITVYIRDAGHLILIATQLGFYLTPIMYPLHVVPERYQYILQWNPILHLVRPFQTILYEGGFPPYTEWMASLVVACSTGFFSLLVFKRLERRLIFRL